MGFASSDEDGYVPHIESSDRRFYTVKEALDYADGKYSEYGASVHPECADGVIPELEVASNGHFLDCPTVVELFSVHDLPDECQCKEIESDWLVKVLPVSA